MNLLKVNSFMYDNIRLLMPYPFKDEPEKETFCKRFGLFVKDEKKGILHNKGYETLEQNKGIYIKVELPTAKRKGNLTLSFSLHKLYNAHKKKGLCNYDDFGFCQANEAYKQFNELLTIDLSTAIVKKYEVGINIITTGDPDGYMKELSQITVKAREMRIIEDSHFKEYKQYSTHKDKDKRIIYIFYNKTYEARTKTKAIEKRETVPENILRIEKDNHRPVEKVYFSQLFDSVYQQLTKQEFQQRFIQDLQYKEYTVKTKDISTKQLEIIEAIEKQGIEKAIQEQKELLRLKNITKSQYDYFTKQIKAITENNIKAQRRISPLAEEMKQLIISKLKNV